MDVVDQTHKAPWAGRREWIGLAVLALPTLLLSLDLSVLYLALPHLSADLAATSAHSLWIIDIYGFMIAGFLVTMGTLGDRIGRRRLLLAGAFAFSVASVLAAYSTSPEMLIATRALLGIAGATLMPSTLALITNMFTNDRQRAFAIAVWMSCFMGGLAIGPVIGGTMLQLFWWGSVFLMGVPVMLLLLVTGPLLLPEHREPGAGRLDLISVAMSLGAILPVIYCLKEVARDGLRPLPVAIGLMGVAVGVAFVRRQRRLTSPLLDLRLFGNRSFSAALGIMLLSTVTMGGVTLLVAQHLQLVADLSPLTAGLLLVPASLSVIGSNLIAPRLGRLLGPGYAVAAGLIVAAVGLVMLTQVRSTGSLPLLVTGYAIAFFGIGPMGVLGTNLVMGATPPEKAGSAAAVSETNGEFGIAFGIALLGSLATLIYRNQIAGNVPPDVPPDVAGAARDNLVAAVSAAEDLPSGLGTELLDTAREAFVTGLNVIAGISAVAVVLYALLSIVLLRHIRPEAEESSNETSGDHPDSEDDAAEAARPVEQ